MLVASIVIASLAAAPEWADPGIRVLDEGGLFVVSFRTTSDAWGSDACGRIYRSSDGGRGWVRDPDQERSIEGLTGEEHCTHAELLRLTWLSTEIGLAFRANAPPSRTTDGGKTWSPLDLVPGFGSAAVETIGDTIWTCDRSGALSYSSDQGVRWLTLPPLFKWPRVDGCESISFVDPDDGWVMASRSLWETHDRGRSWQRIRTPELFGGRTLVRVSANEAWSNDFFGRRLHTVDRGNTWVEDQITEPEPTVLERRSDGRPLLFFEKQGARQVSLSSARIGVDSAHVLTPELAARAQWVHRGPVLSPRTDKRVLLEHVSTGGGVRWGVAGQTVFRTSEDGTWFPLKTSPSPVRKIAALETGDLLIKTDEGLFRGDDIYWNQAPEPWKPASLLDQFDWTRLTGEATLAPSPGELDCFDFFPGKLTVDWEFQGCFGGSHGQLDLTVKDVSGEFSAYESFQNRHPHGTLPVATARAWAKRLLQAATRAEVHSHGSSTTRVLASIRWTCGGGVSRELKFDTYETGRWLFTSPDVEVYSRPNGLIHEAEALLDAK